MRRTLALAGAAVFGVTGLAGPASADLGAGIVHHNAVHINEVGAELGSASPVHNLEGGFIEIKNKTSSTVDIGGWTVIGCTIVDVFAVTIPAGTLLGPGEVYLVGDDDFNGTGTAQPDQVFGSGEILMRAAGGAALEDATGPLVDEIAWGVDPVSCAITAAGTNPTDNQTINHGNPWFLEGPTPGSCG